MMAIRDQAMEAFMQPFFTNTTAQAERMFRDTAEDDKSSMWKHPEDYDLYHLGTWDDNTGELLHQVNDKGEIEPRIISRGRDYKRTIRNAN